MKEVALRLLGLAVIVAIPWAIGFAAAGLWWLVADGWETWPLW